MQNATKEVAGSAKAADPAFDGINLAFDLRTLLASCHWSYQNQMLEMLDWICSTDRQHDKARSRMLRLINDQERAMKAIVDREVRDPAMKKAKETK